MVCSLSLFRQNISRNWLRLGIALLVTMLIGCGYPLPRPTDAPRPPMDAEQQLYLEADRLWRQGVLDQAMTHFSRYLAHYPGGRNAAEALQRLGDIYHRMGERDPARAFYMRVIERFPQTPAADEARLALIDLLIEDDRSEEAIAMADDLLSGASDPEVREALWRRLLELHAAADDSVRVAWYASLLGREGPVEERERWAEQLRQTIARLDIGEIEWLWDRVDDRGARGDMMYRYGVLQTLAENDDVALEVLVAFGRSNPDHPDATDAAALVDTLTKRLSFSPLTLGCLLPLSGSHESFGLRVLQAIEMALNTVREGDRRLPIRLVVEDTASSDEGAVKGVRALAKAGVGAIIGPIITAPAAALEAQRLKIPMVAFTQRPEITDVGDYIFRHFITPQNQVKTLVEYFITGLGMRRFAILYPEEAYGRTFMHLFWDEVARQGGNVVAVVPYDSDQTDFATTIGRLVGPDHSVPTDLQARSRIQLPEQRRNWGVRSREGGSGYPVTDTAVRLSGLFHEDGGVKTDDVPLPPFDVLFIPDGPRATGLILPQLAYHDVTDILLAGTNLWHSPQLLEMAREFAQNAIVVDGFFKESQLEVVRRFVDGYRDLYAMDPGLVEAFAYDTAQMLFNLVDQPELRLRTELRDALKQVAFANGVTGTTLFDHRGEALKTLSLLRIQGNRFAEIEPQ